jgi:CubicO group peptidase (beta-lactamase class C family)
MSHLMPKLGGLALALVALVPLATARADTAAPTVAAVPSEAAATNLPPDTSPRLTEADVGAWLDGFMPNALQQADIAGAVVVVVKDGKVLVERGYGYADLKTRAPMDPARTLVRPGSVSKLFTWTAVMQLVEQGKIDLDGDINQYLDFKVDGLGGKPITMRHLMTHTAGFEETLKHLIGKEGEPMPDFEVLLKERVPARIFAPGTTPAYSNYATSLAGYIVQRVSGLSFYDYVTRNIFQPLGMQHTTFLQPLPEQMKPQMSEGYENASGKPQPFELIGPAPAGSVSTTAADMARFMIAHLQDGQLGEARILQPATAQLMHGSPLTIIPGVNRMLLGFYESDYDGRRVIAHGGDTVWFHSDLHLFLDDGIGLFVSFNSPGKDGASHALRTTLKDEFADRYLPRPQPPVTPIDEQTARDHAKMIAGHYLNSRRVETTFMSLLGLVSELKVIDNGDGTIGVSMLQSPTGKPYRWREIEPFVWQQEGDTARLVAETRDGDVTRFTVGALSPFMYFEPPAPSKSGRWLLPVAIASVLVLLATALAWPVSVLARRYFRTPAGLAPGDASAQRQMRLVALATVVAWGAWIGLMVAMMSDFSLLAPKTDPLLYALQIFGAIVFVGGTLLGLWAVARTLRGGRTWIAKSWAVLVAVALLVSLWVAIAFHVLSFGVLY